MSVKKVHRQTLEYQEGRNAYCEGVRRGQNPYYDTSRSYSWWLGWDDEEADQQQSDQPGDGPDVHPRRK